MLIHRQTGRYVRTTTVGEAVKNFVPHALPPEPPLDLDIPTLERLARATWLVGRLDGFCAHLPEIPIYLYLYIRKEAVLSSQIEGTQSSLKDLLFYESEEMPGVPLEDVEEVSSYVAAMRHGLDRLKGGFPLSSRLLREIHGVLLARGRGSESGAGEFRRSQNWIGGTRPGNAFFVPPPPELVPDAVGDLERFLHTSDLPILIKAALAHVQFETIHPFLDGNGRLGRLLITLLLCGEELLREPVLYLSLYFKLHREHYYELLQRVRKDGDWETWVCFFLDGVIEVAEGVLQTSEAILELFAADRKRIESLGRASASALEVYDQLRRKPVVSAAELAGHVELSRPTITAALARLIGLGLVREETGRKRDRVYVYTSYLELLNEATEPLGK